MIKNKSELYFTRYSTEEDEARDKVRDVYLHKAVKKYQSINHQLAMKLFQTTQSQRHRVSLENLKYFKKQHSKQSIQQSRMAFIDRKIRRENLGIEQADIINHTNRLFGRTNSQMKRKKPKKVAPNKFEVSTAIKNKHNIKGFTAKISHSLGRKSCVSMLTKMINTDLGS